MVPVAGNVPLQPPDAAQLLALVALHCSVTGEFFSTLLALAFRLTSGGATAGVVAALLAGVLLAAGVLVAGLGDVNAFELWPHAASALSTVNAKKDFNASANLDRRLRRIELITHLPGITATIFPRSFDSVHPQSLRSHIHSIF